MAEIEIQRKERSAWPWVLLALVLLALVAWWLFARGDRDVTTETRPGAIADTAAAAVAGTTGTAAGMTAATSGAVNDYLRFADDARARGAMGLDHEYTADGIRRLAGALGEITDRDTVGQATLRPQVDSLRTLADALQRDAQSTSHARYVHDAFTRAASMMEDLQQRRYQSAGDAVSEVRRAAEAVQAGRPLLEQRAEVQQFFDRSAAALRGMTGT